MGLFRRRAKKSREQAAVLTEQTNTAEVQPEVARREVIAEAQPEVAAREVVAEEQADVAAREVVAEKRAEAAPPDVAVEEQAEVARREVTAEARPNPDSPGWGQTLGQELGRARAHRVSQE
ncbi:MAG: hypothetical protein ACTHKL_01895 [Streptosporangiaceae bacterium]